MLIRVVDDKRYIAVQSNGGIFFYPKNSQDIIPALHYLEMHRDAIGKPINVLPLSELSGLDDEVRVEVFEPSLVRDKKGSATGYLNYNFVFFNNQLTYPMEEVLGGFSQFLSGAADKKPKKVMLKEFDPGYLLWFLRAAEMKREKGDGLFHYYLAVRGRSVPSIIYFQGRHLSSALRRMVRDRKKFPESDLERRIVLPNPIS